MMLLQQVRDVKRIQDLRLKGAEQAVAIVREQMKVANKKVEVHRLEVESCRKKNQLLLDRIKILQIESALSAPHLIMAAMQQFEETRYVQISAEQAVAKAEKQLENVRGELKARQRLWGLQLQRTNRWIDMSDCLEKGLSTMVEDTDDEQLEEQMVVLRYITKAKGR